MPATAPAPQLVVVRHGESTANASEQFSGWRDVALTARGRQQASAAGAWLAERGVTFTVVYTSMLQRAVVTADLLLAALGQAPPREARWQLNERHCGALQGLDRAAAKTRFGRELARTYRRSWTEPPPPVPAGSSDDPRTEPRYAGALTELPLGESMGDLWRRVDRCWQQELLPRLQRGERLLVVGHGMALRALAKSIERLPEPALPPWKLASAAPRCYHLDAEQQVRSIESFAPDGRNTDGAAPDSDAPDE
jgi:2,3-bisphosphoglycerate-dependent phosphoglycerate mutase